MSLLPPDRLLRLAFVLESSEVAVIGNNLDGIITDWNRGAEQLYGYPAEEVIGKAVSLLIPPAHSDDFPEVMRTLLRSESVAHHETAHRKRDGGRVDVSLSVVPIRNGGGEIVGAVAIARDIGERKRQEAALRESEDRYRDLVEHTEDLLCTHDLGGRLLSVNLAAARTLGYEVDEMLKVPLREFIAPEYREQFDQYLARIKTMGADKGLMAVVARNGECRIWDYNNTVRTEGVPTPIVRGMAHDITERKASERELRASEERLRLATRAGRMYAYEWDVATDVVKRSPEYMSILGLKEEPTHLT